MQAFWGGIRKTYRYGINTLFVERVYPLVINERGTKFTIIICIHIYCHICLFTMKTERPIFLARTLLHIFWIVRAEFLFMRIGATFVAGDRLTMSADTMCVSRFPAIPAETIFCLQGFHFGFASVFLGWGGVLTGCVLTFSCGLFGSWRFVGTFGALFQRVCFEVQQTGWRSVRLSLLWPGSMTWAWNYMLLSLLLFACCSDPSSWCWGILPVCWIPAGSSVPYHFLDNHHWSRYHLGRTYD